MSKGLTHIGNVIDAYSTRQKEKADPGLPTGIASLDEKIEGLHSGDVFRSAAPPHFDELCDNIGHAFDMDVVLLLHDENHYGLEECKDIIRCTIVINRREDGGTILRNENYDSMENTHEAG